MRETIGTSVVPSVKLSTETSGPSRIFLDDHAVAPLCRRLILASSRCTAASRLGARLRDHDALAERQAVRLDDDGDTGCVPAQIGHAPAGVVGKDVS
jgi:hypothetical protein